MLRAILIALMMFAVAPAYAGKFDDAYPAYERKDYSTAVRLWRELAKQGDANAQFKRRLNVRQRPRRHSGLR